MPSHYLAAHMGLKAGTNYAFRSVEVCTIDVYVIVFLLRFDIAFVIRDRGFELNHSHYSDVRRMKRQCHTRDTNMQEVCAESLCPYSIYYWSNNIIDRRLSIVATLQ